MCCCCFNRPSATRKFCRELRAFHQHLLTRVVAVRLLSSAQDPGAYGRHVRAQQIGAVPIDDQDGDVGERIRELTNGLGADCGAECVGYQCHNSH
jgi:threonine dehydrogenase-like Zn-dependent dehydrogenase